MYSLWCSIVILNFDGSGDGPHSVGLLALGDMDDRPAVFHAGVISGYPENEKQNIIKEPLMGKLLWYFTGVVLLLIFPFFSAAHSPVTIKVGVYENGPKIFTNKDGIVTGFWADLIQHISEKENWQIEWVSGTWTQGLARLNSGEIDIMPDTGWTEPRNREFAFSNETVLVSWSRLYVPQNSKITSVIDLSGKTIAALKGSFNLEGPEGIREILYKFNIDATIREMDSYEQIFEALQQGKIDAGVTNKDFGNRNEENYTIERTAIIFQPSRMQFAFTKDADTTPLMMKRIDTHIKALKKDKNSIYYKALDEYIGRRSAEPFVEIIPGWVKIVSAVAFGMILFLLAVGIASRIQVRRRTAELYKSEEKYRTLVNNAPDLRYRTDKKGTIIFISASYYKLSGYSTKEAVGMAMAEIYAFPSQRDAFLSILKKQGYVSDFEAQLKRKDGSIWWASTNAIFYKDSGGNILGVEGVTRDITERKKYEDALQKSERKYRQLFHNAPAGIYEIDLEKNKITSVNDVMCKYTGYSKEAFLHMAPLDFMAQDSKMVLSRRLGNPNLEDNLTDNVEYSIIRKNGKRLSVFLNIDFVYSDGCIGGARIVVNDITKLKKAETEKLRAQKLAGEQKKLALVGQIAGKMAHDFNNVLGIIMGDAELSLLDCNDARTKKTLELIHKQTIRGKNLTKNLVAFANDQEPMQKFFKITEKIDLVVSLMEKDLKEIELIKEYRSKVQELFADPGMIEHSLVNLIQNSIHAASLKPFPRIIIRTYCSNGDICFEIEDNGCGIPKEAMEFIYDPSFSLKGVKDVTRSYKVGIKGTGYGMANVKKYIEQHNGSLKIKSEFGSGTTCTIRLPVIKIEPAGKENTKTREKIMHIEKHILLVEDETDISDLQYKILTRDPCNHKVDIANDGQVAMDLFGKNKYELVSLDYVLPGNINGMDVYKHIRETDKTIPILFVSGNIEFLESIKTLKQKDLNIDHQPKPCLNEDYLNSINRLLERSLTS